MYDGSFDPDALKNTKTNAAHDEREALPRETERVRRRRRASARQRRQRRPAARAACPTTNNGTKYYHAPGRSCAVVQEALEVLVDEEELGELAFARDTATNHGAVSAR